MVSSNIIQQSQSISSIDQFLDIYQYIFKIDLDRILKLDFEFDHDISTPRKITPIIEIAKPKDAQAISNTYIDVYNGTYPYKKMENVRSIEELIKSPNDYIFLFKLESNEIIGAFSSHLEFEKKRGLLYGFVIKKEYRKVVDNLKAFLGSAAYLWKKYYNEILIWYGEIRSNESAAQFATNLFGLKPIAFFPNKDIFFKKLESDILHIIHNQDALLKYRMKEKPQIIRQVLNSYYYSNNRYKLGLPIVKNPSLKLDNNKLDKIRKNIQITTIEQNYGSKKIIINNKQTKNFYEFLYNRYSKNFETIEYKSNSLEELYTFLEIMLNLFKEMEINYAECYVSAYNAKHQKIFHNLGFRSRGYVPSWYYNRNNNLFEDRIVFNLYKGTIDNNINLIPEVKELIDSLNKPDELEFEIM